MNSSQKIVPYIITVITLLLGQGVYAQVPQGINYQAIIRDAGGAPHALSTADVRITYSNGGGSFQEEFLAQPTNQFGVLTITLGSDNVAGFQGFDWKDVPVTVQVEANTGGGYVLIGNVPFVSVPYSLIANDLVQLNGSPLSVTGAIANDVLTFDGAQWGAAAPSSSPWDVSGSNISYTTGNVGVGVTPPTSRFHVEVPAGGADMKLTSSTGLGLTRFYFTASERSVIEAGQLLEIHANGSGPGLTIDDADLNINTNVTFANLPSSVGVNDTTIIRMSPTGYAKKQAMPASFFLGSPWERIGANIAFNGGYAAIGNVNPAAAIHIGEVFGTPVGASPDQSIYLSYDNRDVFYETRTGDMSSGLLMTDNNRTTGLVHHFAGDYLTGQDPGLHLFTETSEPLMIKTNNIERMRIMASGLIGVGTTTPAWNLHLHEESASGNPTISFTNSTTGQTTSDGFYVGLSLSEQALINNREDTDMIFYTNGLRRLTIDKDGEVGIGSSNSTPDYALHVTETNADATGTDGAYLSIQNLSGTSSSTTATSSGIVFNNTNRAIGDYYKAGIYFSRDNTSGRGDMIFAINNDANSTNVSTADAIMTIEKEGQVGIGTIAPISSLHVEYSGTGYVARFTNLNTSTGDGVVVRLGPTTPTTTNYFMLFQKGIGLTAGSINGNGSGGVNFNTTSDRRLKQNITDLSGALTIVKAMKPRQYQFKEAPTLNRYGFIAQELMEVLPEVVSGDPNGDVTTEPMMIDYSKLTPILAKALQEQQIEIELLRKEIEALKNSK